MDLNVRILSEEEGEGEKEEDLTTWTQILAWCQ